MVDADLLFDWHQNGRAQRADQLALILNLVLLESAKCTGTMKV